MLIQIASKLKYYPDGDILISVKHFDADKSPAVIATTLEGEQVAKLIICIPGLWPSRHKKHCIIKDWLENEGTIKTLKAARLIEPEPFDSIRMMHTSAHIYQMKGKLLKAWEQLNETDVG